MSLPARKHLPHAIPGWVRSSAVYLITICAAERGKNTLCHHDLAAALFETIEFDRDHGVWWPHLVVLMPDHLHALFTFAPDPGMKKAISDWKHYTRRILGIAWQRDFFDHRIRSTASYDEKASYLRQNPVRAGLITAAENWPYTRAWPVDISIR